MKLAGKLAATAGLAVALALGAATDRCFGEDLQDRGGRRRTAARSMRLGEKFVELFEAEDGWQAQGIKMFLNGQLGSEQDTVNDAAIGTLDFSVLAINNITPFSPTVGVLTLPYVILSLDEAVKLTQGDVGKELTENTIRDAGVRIIGWTYAGYRVLSNSKKPIKTMEDLEGVVVRVPKNEIMIDTYNSWGNNPTPMAWSETFTALQQGVVDGQDNPYLTIHSMKFYEVQKYITNLRYLFLARADHRQRGGLPGPVRGSPEGDPRGRPGGDGLQRPVSGATPKPSHQGRPDRQGHADRRSGQR